MKEGWTYRKLGEVTDFSQGIQVDVNLQSEICSPGKVRFLRIIDVTQGNVPPRYIDDPGERYYLKTDEIAMVRYGTVGFVCYGFEGVIANNLFKISIKDKSKLQSNYLQYFLKSDLFQTHIRKGVGGAALPAIKFGDIKHIILGFPSLSEQQSIVDYLDSAFAKIDAMKANAEKALNEAKALFQASLKEMLEPKEGWEEKKLKETAKYRRGSFPQPYGNKEWYDGEGSMPFVQVAELQEDSFNLVPITKRLISKIAQPLSVFVPAGTVLVTLQGSIGKVAITDYDSYVDRTIAIFQDYKIAVDKTFFAYQLKIRFEIERLKARGTTIKTITKEEFANFIINCPPLSEQQSIVATLDSLKSKVDRLQANYDKISQECDALKQAILRQVFE